jgi:hypothetical protein
MVSSVNVHNVALQSWYFSTTNFTKPSGLQTRAPRVNPSIQMRLATFKTFSDTLLKISYALTAPLKSRDTNEQRIVNENENVIMSSL